MSVKNIGVSLSQESLELLVASIWVDSTPEEIQTIVAIGMAESGGRINVVNDNVASGHQEPGSIYQWDDGWPQINSVHGFDRDKLTSNPEYAAIAALSVFEKQGFGAWVGYKTSRYLQYMGELSSTLIQEAIVTLLLEDDDADPIQNPPKDAIRVVPLRRRGILHRYLVEVNQPEE